MRVDPTEVRVRVAPHASDDEAFSDLMADQLRHAPWLLLSVVIHAITVVIIMLIPAEAVREEAKAVQMKPPEKEEEIQEPEKEPEKVEEEQEEEPVLVDAEVPEEDVPMELDTDFESPVDSELDSTQWTTEIGLGGGGPAGKFGNRKSGLGDMRRGGNPAAPVIEMALEWLADHQDDDGKWDADDFAKHDVDGTPCDGAGNPVHDVGVTGLALLAFLSEGSTMRAGTYKDEIKKGIRWLRGQQDEETGLFGSPASQHFVYDHAIAALAMTEAAGLSESRFLRKYAQRGLEYLEFHRNPYGVWRYQPQDNQNDTSVTGWCVLVYKSAQDFGLQVNKQALNDCEAWFDQVTDPMTGRAGYMKRGELSSRHRGDHQARFPPERGEALTAVALMARCFLGQTPKTHPIMTTAADTILDKPPTWNTTDGSIDHYYWYYATYALYQMGKHHWRRWQKHLNDAVIDTVRTDGNFKGSWDPIGVWGDEGGRVYSTAILALTLQAYYRYTRLIR